MLPIRFEPAGSLGRGDSVPVRSTTVAKIPTFDTFDRPTAIRRSNADTTVFTYYGVGTHRNVNNTLAPAVVPPSGAADPQ